MKLLFNNEACQFCKGLCCNGSSGYIWVSKKEIEKIAAFLNISTENFIKEYLYKINYKFSIREININENYACVFYDEEKNNCSIYKVRPVQCRTYPFWEEIIKDPFQEALFCPGIIIR